jgi:hypothetical protein
VTARQTAAARALSFGAAIGTGALGTTAGVVTAAAGLFACSAVLITREKIKTPTSSMIGTATAVAQSAAVRVVRSGEAAGSSGRVCTSTMT